MTRLIDEMHAGYMRVTRTVICPYCWTLRSIDNLHQVKPRVKCKPCFAGKRK